MPEFVLCLLVGLPFMVLDDLSELGLKEPKNFFNGDRVRDPANEHLSFGEGSLDAEILLIDRDLFEGADLLNFGGRDHQKNLVFSLLLPKSDMLRSQLGLRQRIDNQRLDLKLGKQRHLVDD